MRKQAPLHCLAALLVCVACAGHAQKLDLTESQLRVLQQHLVPLDTVNPDAPQDDLAFLRDFVGDARIVALGEATHGNREFSQMKHRIIEYLVEEMGFGVVAFEVNMPEARHLHRYVRNGGEESDAFASTMYSVWQTHEVHDLVEWLRSHNASERTTVHFAGFDMQSPLVAVPNVLRFLEQVDPEFVDEAASHYDVPMELREAEDQIGYRKRTAPQWRRGANQVLDHVLAHAEEYGRTLPSDAVAVAIQDARLVLQAALMMYYGDTRDALMANNVQWLLERHPNQRFVLWAHNSHVAEAKLEGWADSERMGWHLANALGSDYVSIGFIFGHGAYHGRDINENEIVISKLPRIEGSIGGQLGRLDEPLFFLPLRDLAAREELHPLVGGTVYARSLGATSSSRVTGLKAIPLSEAFDGIIYIDEVSPSNRLP